MVTAPLSVRQGRRAEWCNTPVKSLFALAGSAAVDHYGERMRLHLVFVAGVIGLVLLSGCSSDSSTKRTVTAIVTVSSASPASGSSAGSASASANPTPSPSPTKEPIVKVDPLKADCAAVISSGDVKKIFKVDIPSDRKRIVDVGNPDRGQSGRIRCLYGLKAGDKSGAVSLVLTKYTSAAAAQKQVDVTVSTETDLGAKVIKTTVKGYPATMLLRDGGLIVMVYDSWTLAVAVAPDKIDAATMEAGLPQLADAALTRVLKS